MVTRALEIPATLFGVTAAATSSRAVERRVAAAVAAHHTFIWRALRRFGVAEEHADDAAQQVFCVFARRLAHVPMEKEKTFLCGVAVRVAQGVRRDRSRRPLDLDDAALEAARSATPLPDEELEERRARAILDRILDALPPDHRTVFVLHELEELTMAEIAAALSLPPGTVASRLRRARELFDALALPFRTGATE
jgi:RNA polymerase sigma-70 factor (ECF subfamily)